MNAEEIPMDQLDQSDLELGESELKEKWLFARDFKPNEEKIFTVEDFKAFKTETGQIWKVLYFKDDFQKYRMSVWTMKFPKKVNIKDLFDKQIKMKRTGENKVSVEVIQ